MRYLRAFPALIAALLLVLASGRAFAEPVTVKGGAHKDYGRLVFTWTRPTPHTASIKGRTLTVKFSRPIEATYTEAVSALRNYISQATPGGDGMSVTFSLKGDYALSNFDMGRSVVIDLFNKTPPPAAKPVEPAKPRAAPVKTVEAAPKKPVKTREVTEKAETIGVRVGRHPTYSRIVFDWPSQVDYQVEEGNGAARVTFNRPALFKLDAITRRPPPNVTGAEGESGNGSSSVLIATSPGATIKHFTSGPKVVIDVGNPTRASIAAAKNRQKLAKNTPSLATAPPPKAAPTKPVTKAEVSQVASTTADTKGKNDAVATAKGQPASADKGAKPDDKTPPPTDLKGQPSGLGKPLQLVAGQEGDTGDFQEFTLRFPWTEPVAAAVFRRSGTLWVVFDRQTDLDIKAIKAAGLGTIRDVIDVPVNRATVLRLVIPESINPRIGRDGFDWTLKFMRQPLKPQNIVDSKSEKLPSSGARLFMPVPQAGLAIPIRDQNAGDNLVVVPVVPLGQGVGQVREYVEFRVLPSAQGIAIEPKIDDLRVRPFIQGVELTSQTALNVTPLDAKLEAAAKVAMPGTMSRVFDFVGWQMNGLPKFNEDRQALEYQISMAKGKPREKARMKLAQFYLANSMGAEADAVLRLVRENRPEISIESEYAAILGAAKFLKSRYRTAARALGNPGLTRNDEALFWLAASQAASGDLVTASENLRRFGGIIRTYPRNLKMTLGALAIETAIASGDVKAGERFLDLMKVEDPTPREKGLLDYLQGRVLELGGNIDKAVKKWEEAAAGAHRPSRAKAAYARAEVLRVLEKIENKEAIEELEKLRFAWRGDDFEFNLLRKLGVLYFTEKDYRNALLALKQAATHFRRHPRTPEVTQEMSLTFTKLYLDGEADEMTPVRAIALYEEFKELTPAGDKGDLMIRRLADRLVAVDLLDRAAKLLENQVKFRLKGAEKAKVGAKLALIHMMNRKLEQALRVLAETDVPGIPAELAETRRHLQARTLMELKRGEEALIVLTKDESQAADLIRSEMFWRTRKWADAAQSLRRVVNAMEIPKNAKLDDKQGKYILNLGVALVLGGNERGLARVREKYEAQMDKSAYADAFQLITSAASRGLIDFRTVSRRVKEVESFQAFMAAYQERLKESEEKEDTDEQAGEQTAAAPAK